MSELQTIKEQCVALGRKISGKLGLNIDVALTNSFVLPEESFLPSNEPLLDTQLPLAITVRIATPSHMQVRRDAMTIAREEFANLIIANSKIHGLTLGDVSKDVRHMRIYLNSDFVCKEHPELLLGQPIGFYNCPKCTMPLMAGVTHPPLDEKAKMLSLTNLVDGIVFDTLSGWGEEINFSVTERHPHSRPVAFNYADAKTGSDSVQYKVPMAVPIGTADQRVVDVHINVHRSASEQSKTLTEHRDLIVSYLRKELTAHRYVTHMLGTDALVLRIRPIHITSGQANERLDQTEA